MHMQRLKTASHFCRTPHLRVTCFDLKPRLRSGAGPPDLATASFSRRLLLCSTTVCLQQFVDASRPARATSTDESKKTWQFAFQTPAFGEQSQPNDPACTSAVDPKLAALLTRVVYNTAVEQKLLDETGFQREVFLLRDQEFRYYQQANSDKLPALPDLSDSSGGLSNPAYFNFLTYILWKVVARHVTDDGARVRFTEAAGKQLLNQLAGDVEEELTKAAVAGGGQADRQQLVRAVQKVLDRLQGGGFMCGYQVVWGSQPGALPRNWFVGGEVLQGAEQLADAQAPALMQVRLHKPADIEGSVALRAEEDGFWNHSVSAMLRALLASAGYQSAVDEYFFQDEWSGPRSWTDRLLMFVGDPLQQVEVPWSPTTLVQNWSLEG